MKKLMVLFLLLNILLLCSCSIGGSRLKMLNADTDDKKADARLDQVIEAIKNKDKDALKSMFSKQALDEAKNIDESIDYLFEVYKGKITSMEKKSITDESNNYGDKTKEVKSFYNVKTDKQEYIFFLLEYTVDTKNADNVGLYALRLIKAEDKETQYSSWQKMNIAGIYNPNDNEDTEPNPSAKP